MIHHPNYRNIERIYEGRHSLVFRAARVSDGQPVILKRLKDELPPVAEMARLEQEFKVTRSLNLPGVVAVYALERDENTRFLVLEDFGGQALSLAPAGHVRSLDSCLRMAVQLAGILIQVHQAGVIHRDFNPANLIWNPVTGQVKLTDFGLALVLPFESPAFQPPAQIDGTLAYLSPEQTGRMNKAVDSRADLYALGATLYALFTGHPPFVSDSPLELVHAHMVRQPVPLRAIRPDVPDVVSDIVMTLLNKEPDARYQTARGVQIDLETCIRGSGAGGRIETFPLAQDDVSDRFQIPQRLYGREPEIGLLLGAFARVSLGAAELLLVAGYSGAGKSSLVHEVHKPITDKTGHFAAGKFNQYQQNVPYSAFQQALTQFCLYALGDGAQLQHWRRAILEAVGVHGQLLIDVIPALEWIIGRQPAVEVISPQEAQNRFNTLFRRFLGVLCRQEHPLVLFIDDWQWADAASIHLLTQLFADTPLRHLLVICAYRDNEVEATHPFMMAIDELRQQTVPVGVVTVQNLTPRDLGALVADTLHQPVEQVSDLVALVNEKTLGNPFFAKSFLRMLHDDDLLTFDRATRQWRWDLAQLRRLGLTDNVVDLLEHKIRRLPPDTQVVLSLAASVGNRFDLQTLAIIGQHPPGVCFDRLWPAVTEGLVVPLDEHYHLIEHPAYPGGAIFRFLHDRVQQAAYALIAVNDRPRVHHRIGQLLLAELSPEQRMERLFEVVDHLNAGQSLITAWEEQVGLIRLNLEAARKARSATAYRAARQYVLGAFHFLESDAQSSRLWAEHGALALDVYKDRSEIEYLNGDFTLAEQFIRQAADRAPTPVEKAEALHILIVQYTLLARYPEAIATGRLALATLGITLPDDDYEHARDAEMRAVKETIGDRSVASLFDLPVMSDPEKRTAAKLLITMGPPCYRSHQKLWAVIVPKVVNLCLRYGNIPQVGYSHTAFGGLLGYVSNDYATAIQFGDLATRLMTETFRSASDRSVFHLMIGSSLRHWSAHLKHATEDYKEAYQVGLRSSNLQYAAYAFGHNMYCRFYQGTALDELMKETERSLAFSLPRRNQWAIDLLDGGLLAFGTLAGSEPVAFSKGPLTERDFLRRCDAHRNIQVTCIYKVLRTFVLYVQGDYELALASSDESEPIIFTVGTQGLLPWAEHVFVRALIQSALHSRVDATRQRLLRADVQQHLRQLRVWADHAPGNFEHKWLLVSAELARIEDRPLEAIDFYDQAITGARDQGFVQHQAIASECAARFWLERNKGHLAQTYLRQAHYAYGLWGAAPKVRSLEAEHGEWLWPGPGPADHPITTDGSRSLQDLDAATVVSIARSLSETVQLEPLLETLMRLALAHAGADVGMLLLPEDGNWLIQAHANLNGIKVLQASPADASRVPLSIVLYAERTQSPFVMSHPAAQPAHAHDAYLRTHRPMSVCALPLLYRSRLIAMLYLENNVAGGVFAPAQVELLQMLSSQMASAIVNAQLYDNLEKAVDERTSQLQQSLAEVKTLKGLLPICASCKKVRDDHGFWSQIESYISRHSDAQFTHGICPDCSKRLYPDV